MTAYAADLLVTLSQSTELALFAKVTVLAGLGLAGTRLAARARASVRHALLAATFGTLLMLPFVSYTIPSIDLIVSIAAPDASPPLVSPASRETGRTNVPFRGTPSTASVATEAARSTTLGDIARGLWLFGALTCCIPLAARLWHLRRLRRGATPWGGKHDLVTALAADAGISRTVEIALHEGLSVPVTFGMRRPTILMPLDARTWAEGDLRRALVHELEHVRRRDWPLLLLARIACAVYWPHPLVWIAGRQMALDTERACDDAVLLRERETMNDERVAYAEQLVGLAERLSASTWRPVLGMADRNDLTTRVRALLDPRQRRGRIGVGARAGVLAIGLVAVTLVAPMRVVADSAASSATSARPVAQSAITPAEAGAGRRPRPTAIDRALYGAAAAGDLEGMEALWRAGADLNAALSGDGSPLIAAARWGGTDAVTWLLDRGADPNLGVEGDGSALIAAAALGRASVIELLLDRGADIDQVVPVIKAFSSPGTRTP